MNDILEPDDAATPLTPEEMRDLIPAHIAYRSELNEAEQENIARAQEWALGPRWRDLLSEKFAKALHRRMLGDVWRWAGTERQRVTNIGVDPAQIAPQLAGAMADARYWHDNGVFSQDERAARLHFRLVSIHPFPNGNGRCTRLLSDLYLLSIDAAPFTWGAANLEVSSSTREAYMAALVAAPLDDCASLLTFARS